MPINRQSSTPIKVQVKRELLKLYLSGENQPDKKLPSERTLQEQFGISRTTLRIVLDELQREGMLYSHPGKGRYIAKKILDQQLTYLTGLSQEIRDKGIEPIARVLYQQVETAQPYVAEKLQIPEGSKIFRLKRLRFAEKKPVSIEETHISISLCPNIVNIDFQQASLYDFLSSEGLRPVSAFQVMTAEDVTDEEASLLKIDHPRSLMRMKRTTFLISGKPIEYAESAYSGADFQFTLHLKLETDFTRNIRQTN